MYKICAPWENKQMANIRLKNKPDFFFCKKKSVKELFLSHAAQGFAGCSASGVCAVSVCPASQGRF